MLGEWLGQLRGLPPPSAGVMALTNHKRLGYSCAGGEQRGGHAVWNTVHNQNLMKWGFPTGSFWFYGRQGKAQADFPLPRP